MYPHIPKIDKTFSELAALNYRQLAVYLLSLYLTDFTEAEITKAVDCAYDDKFRTRKLRNWKRKITPIFRAFSRPHPGF